MISWIDTHVHLQDERYADDLDDVLARAKAAGVDQIILATSNVEDSKYTVELALEHGLYTTVGVHPHDAKTWHEHSLSELEELVLSAKEASRRRGRDPVVVAIGEIGLDYHYDFSPRDIQREVFYEQMKLSKKLALPLVFHVREAYKDFLDLIDRAKKEDLFLDTYPGVLHCYSGSKETAKRLLPYGFMFGFDGPITFKNAMKPLEVVRALPLDRLVLETDGPYLTPVPFRGKRNEPSYLPYIGEKVAALKNVEIETVASQTSDNARKLFRLAK